MIAAATGQFLGTLSSPMEGLAVKEWLVDKRRMNFAALQREGRITSSTMPSPMAGCGIRET